MGRRWYGIGLIVALLLASLAVLHWSSSDECTTSATAAPPRALTSAESARARSILEDSDAVRRAAGSVLYSVADIAPWYSDRGPFVGATITLHLARPITISPDTPTFAAAGENGRHCPTTDYDLARTGRADHARSLFVFIDLRLGKVVAFETGY